MQLKIFKMHIIHEFFVTLHLKMMEKMQKRLSVALLVLMMVMAVRAEKHTEFVHLSLAMPAKDMVDRLVEKGLHREDSFLLSGTIAGLHAKIYVVANKDTTGCSHIRLTTQKQHGTNQHADYVALMGWMQKHYGKPDWESMVRSHRFARWFVDFDRDIVMIATASSAVEIWFYDNHEKRQIDYYSILKYCEQNPSPTAPALSAHECVVWKSTPPPVVKKPNKRTLRKNGRRLQAKGKGRRKLHRRRA